MKDYKPAFILQHGVMQVVIAEYYTNKDTKMGHKVYPHKDGGEVLADYFPIDFDKNKDSPILFFFYGAFGYEKAAYV